MALKGGFSRVTPLQLALDRGMRPGAKLGDELGQLGEYSIKSKSDAEAVCRVLGRCVREAAKSEPETSLQALIALFQDVEGRCLPCVLADGRAGTADVGRSRSRRLRRRFGHRSR